LTGRHTRKRREECILFLDDAFDAKESPRKLLDAGYCGVESFLDHFKREDGTKEQSVKDPRVIRLCEKHGWLLVTSDSDIRYTHTEEIKKCKKIAILATAHNSVDDIDEWVDALILARSKVEREFKNRLAPWYAQYNRQGHFTTIYTLTEAHKQTRNRLRENG
jgi:hypothetical protein